MTTRAPDSGAKQAQEMAEREDVVGGGLSGPGSLESALLQSFIDSGFPPGAQNPTSRADVDKAEVGHCQHVYKRRGSRCREEIDVH